MQPHHHQSHHPLLAIFALAALALAVMAPNTLAASQTSPPGPPSFPSAVPTRPGALTYSTPGTTARATPVSAQSHLPGPPNFPSAVPTRPGALTYSSGAPAPLTAQARPISIDTNHGVAWVPFVLALAGALIAGFAASSSLHLLHSRRRRAGQPA
jgi:hypothetical protein